jgi:hypothetical protein
MIDIDCQRGFILIDGRETDPYREVGIQESQEVLSLN